ncbi:MAG: 23S rRNA (adenine(2503)-C(2))-methyltransferase RlmN [Rhodothermaceae bacterium]
MKHQLKGLPLSELNDYFISIGEPKFRAKQIFGWMYNQMVDSFDEMVNVPKSLRSKLEEKCDLYSLKLKLKETSKQSETSKYLFSTRDNKSIETVLIPAGEGRATLCISTQVGCPLSCEFCATGKLGFDRNLTSGEIVDQYVMVAKDYGIENVTNIVYMGMGEPLINFDETVKSLKIITSEFNKSISRTRITVSTSGLPHKIKELADTGLRVKLALSLHSPFEDVRSKIMPINKRYSLNEVIEAIKYYARTTKTRITFEYTMFDGINDRDEDVKELVKICSKLPAKINLIPFNSIKHMNPTGFAAELEPSPRIKIENFADKLRNRDITVLVRETQGEDIAAACGQLAAKDKNGEK